MSTLVARSRAPQAILALLAFAGIASSLGCEPIPIPAGHTQPDPNTPRVAGGTTSVEQSTMYIIVDPPIVIVQTAKWSIGNDVDGWLRDTGYAQTYVANWLSVHNWDFLADMIQDNFAYGFSTSVRHDNYLSPQDFLVTSNANGDAGDCRGYVITVPYWITCSESNYTWVDPLYRTLGAVGLDHATFATSQTEIAWLPE